MQIYPKRLIEVDFPIKYISESARREKDMRRSHVPLLYIWPATRPPAACRAVLCASLWFDPCDDFCPKKYKEEVKKIMISWATNNYRFCSENTYQRTIKISKNPDILNDNLELRKSLFDFIIDFSIWENSIKKEFVTTASEITKISYGSQIDENDSKPLVVDPFSGGGAIPMEAIRVGAESFSSELNPVAVLYNKILLEYIPKYNQFLIDEIDNWYKWMKPKASKILSEYYPIKKNGSIPIAYLWARTINCEGPDCGVEIPLLTSKWIAKKNSNVILKILVDNKKINFEIITNPEKNIDTKGTIIHGSVICPVCGFTTKSQSVKKQLKLKSGGTNNARLFCVVTINPANKGRSYHIPDEEDFLAVKKASFKFDELFNHDDSFKRLVPTEKLPDTSGGFLAPPLYGMNRIDLLFTKRQLLANITYVKLIIEYCNEKYYQDKEKYSVILSVFSLIINKLVDLNASLCVWQLSTPNTAHVFGRWALQMVMDFGEINPLSGAGGSPDSAISRIKAGIKHVMSGIKYSGHANMASATSLPLPNDSVDVFFTDPPYYNAIPYADLSDYFYVWMKRILSSTHNDLFTSPMSPKDDEICEMVGWDPVRYPNKDKFFFEQGMYKSMLEGRRVLNPKGIGIVVFAHKSTSGWEALLQAIVDAGWIITASWPIDTELESRLRAKNSATLSSSIHLVCRPKEDEHGNLIQGNIGDWRSILLLLPKRIHDWMPRLAEEGIVGADAIFSCLGPALEIYSKYSRVEKANGEQVPLKEYLEHIWAAVSKEALNSIFQDADVSGLEEDARITAMWLWTLSTSQNGKIEVVKESNSENENKSILNSHGYFLEYDAARKIAQGLGASLENMADVIEVSGDKTRLLSVSERAKYLFGKGIEEISQAKKKKDIQISLFNESVLPVEEEIPETKTGKPVRKIIIDTTLDKVHKSMLLFAMGRSESLKRYLVEDGIGNDTKYWKLSQALSALYPVSSEEKRWIDGVLAKKKSFGFK
jgi:adenine-specific DNA methylase